MIVEKGIEVTAKEGRRGRRSVYPFADMEPGDSFLSDRSLKVTSAAAYAAGQRLGVRFSCRTVEGGVRVWRVE